MRAQLKGINKITRTLADGAQRRLNEVECVGAHRLQDCRLAGMPLRPVRPVRVRVEEDRQRARDEAMRSELLGRARRVRGDRPAHRLQIFDRRPR